MTCPAASKLTNLSREAAGGGWNFIKTTYDISKLMNQSVAWKLSLIE